MTGANKKYAQAAAHSKALTSAYRMAYAFDAFCVQRFKTRDWPAASWADLDCRPME